METNISQRTDFHRLRRRIFIACGLFALLLLMFPAVVQAESVPFNYTTSNNQVTITKYTGSGGAVSIPDTINGLPVIFIDPTAFSNCVTSIAIPKHVRLISTFLNCTGLASITVDPQNPYLCSVDGVLFDITKRTLIQYPAARTNSSYTIPDSVTSIPSPAFLSCNVLTSVTIPSHLTSIGMGTFANCPHLTAITVDPLNPAYVSVDGVLFNNSQTTILQ